MKLFNESVCKTKGGVLDGARLHNDLDMDLDRRRRRAGLEFTRWRGKAVVFVPLRTLAIR